MPETDAQLIQKIASHEADLVMIYREVYPVLKDADRAKPLPEQVVTDLRSLESPEAIAPSKAAAILKAIIGSTSEDKFGFEVCFSVKMSDGTELGKFVRDRLDKIGIKYHDFWPYLRDRGWLNEKKA
jgi:hypothetical protein